MYNQTKPDNTIPYLTTRLNLMQITFHVCFLSNTPSLHYKKQFAISPIKLLLDFVEEVAIQRMQSNSIIPLSKK